jgi:hypothetical protein
MVHYSRLSKIVIDVPAADHDRELAFWSAATGQPLAQFGRHPEYHGAELHGQDLWLLTSASTRARAGAFRHPHRRPSGGNRQTGKARR